MFVDSHVNLHGSMFAQDLEAVINRAQAAQVHGLLTICCKLGDFPKVYDIASRYPHIWASVGTHPHEASNSRHVETSDLLELSKKEKVIGIGETGLDFHYNYSSKPDQYRNFQAHIEAARESGLPLIIHCRNADKAMAELLENEMKKESFSALLHCYTGGAELAHAVSDMGMYFSVSGILSFKNATDLRKIVKTLPDDRLLIETDCPYLTPVPHRGHRNEPCYVPLVAQALADIKGWSLEESAQRTTDAFFNLFRKAQRPDSL